jgi:predicted nucleotide-binding protein
VDLVPEPSDQTSADTRSRASKSTQKRDVFVVHGRDDGSKETVARFLSKLDLNPIILHEQPNSGKALIEKFIANAQVGYAIVLMTPDDVGYFVSEPEKKEPRARQNVIFELGYFIGLLGREHVCALQRAAVVAPSDWEGVVYIQMDAAGAWRLQLAKEMKHVGLPIDLNNL